MLALSFESIPCLFLHVYLFIQTKAFYITPDTFFYTGRQVLDKVYIQECFVSSIFAKLPISMNLGNECDMINLVLMLK